MVDFHLNPHNILPESARYEVYFVFCFIHYSTVPDSKVHGANMGPIWGRQDPDGPHVGPMNFVIWGVQYNVLLFCWVLS